MWPPWSLVSSVSVVCVAIFCAAAAAGSGALDCGQPAWPTMVLAGKLDRRLAASFPDAAVVGEYRARYTEATAGQSHAEPHPAITQGSPS